MSLRAGAAVPRERASESWRRRGRGAGGPGRTARVPKGPATKDGDGAEEEQGEKRRGESGGARAPQRGVPFAEAR